MLAYPTGAIHKAASLSVQKGMLLCLAVANMKWNVGVATRGAPSAQLGINRGEVFAAEWGGLIIKQRKGTSIKVRSRRALGRRPKVRGRPLGET